MSVSTQHRSAGAITPYDMSGGEPADDHLVATAMAQLAPQHRAVLCRAFYARHSAAQIAADLRISEDAVHAGLHGALLELRATVAQLVADATPPTPQPRRASALRTAICPRRWMAQRA